MTSSIARHWTRSRAALAAAILVGTVSAAAAQVPSPDQISDALTPKPATRSLSLGTPSMPSAMAPASATPEDTAFIDSLRTRTGRSLSLGQREKLATVASGRPSVNLEIPFGFNSASITPETMPYVQSLGAALSKPELKDGTYLIAGHTDGKGSDVMNQRLSERRAEAVKRFLVQRFGLSPRNLITVGYGKSRLKDAGNPLADSNRRVEATNLSDLKAASR